METRAKDVKGSQDMQGRIKISLLAAIKEPGFHKLGSDDFERFRELSRGQKVEQRRSELRNGLTQLQRLFLFGRLAGLNDKDAAIATGYSLSVAENTKQGIWKPQVRAEYERVVSRLKADERVSGDGKAETKG